MDELIKLIAEYKDNNKISTDELASQISISVDQLKDIESGNKKLEKQEIERITQILTKEETKTDGSGKKVVRILDLIFRLTATIMPLVVVILSIYNFKNTNILITLLAVGVACLSMTTLPKIDK